MQDQTIPGTSNFKVFLGGEWAVDKKNLISTMHGNQEGPKVIYCPRPPYNMSLGGTGVLHVHVKDTVYQS